LTNLARYSGFEGERFDDLAVGFDLVAHQNAKGASVPTFMSRWLNLCVSNSNLYVSNHETFGLYLLTLPYYTVLCNCYEY